MPEYEPDSPDPLPKIGQDGYVHDDGGRDAHHDGEDEDGNVGPPSHRGVEQGALLLAPPPLLRSEHRVVLFVARSHQWR